MSILWNSFLGIEETLLSFLLLIDAKIYWAFSQLYKLYVELARARIFSEDMFSNVIDNMYVIVGVVALFIVAFTLLKEMITAEDFSKSGKAIKDLILRFVKVTLLVCVVPMLFDFLYDVQDSILSYGTVQKFILGTKEAIENSQQTITYEDENGNPIFTSDCKASSLEEAKRTCTPLSSTAEVDSTSQILEQYGNLMGYYVLTGFMHPAEGFNASDIEVNASDHFNLDSGLKIGGTLCLIGGGIATAVVVIAEIATSPATGFATLAAVPGTIASFGGTIAGACLGGAAIGLAINGVGYAIDYEHYTWADAQYEIMMTGDFNRITSFAESITAGEIDYLPFISTIGGIVLLYMMFSFCLDLGVRAVKLVFYEALAPVCLMLSIIPNKKDLLANWFKLVLTTWFEVFVRIFCVCAVALLISKLNFSTLSSFGFLAQAIIVLGLVTFAKQVPKLISEVTGLNSGNMKLGIREKLAEGGAFTAGAIIGGGATAFARNLVNAGGNVRNKYKEGRAAGKGVWESVWGAKGAVGAGILSTMAGTVSGQVRSGKLGWSAKSGADMKKAASTGAADAVKARDKRVAYKARHEDNVVGSLVGHIQDSVYDIGRWAGFNNIESLLAQQKTIEAIQSERKTIDSESFDIIDGDLAKGKNDSIYSSLKYNKNTGAYEENRFAKALGITKNMKELREKKAAVDAARASGDAKAIEEAEVAYASYRADWADEIRNISLLGESAWADLGKTADGKSMQADLAKLRIASEKYRETLARNYTASYINSQQGAEDILNRNANLTMQHGALKQIKDDMKIEQTKIATQINRIRQKEQERKDK